MLIPWYFEFQFPLTSLTKQNVLGIVILILQYFKLYFIYMTESDYIISSQTPVIIFVFRAIPYLEPN